jgi:hypothetical protein
MPGAGIEPARREAGDFKSPVSTDSTIEAFCFGENINTKIRFLCQKKFKQSSSFFSSLRNSE